MKLYLFFSSRRDFKPYKREAERGGFKSKTRNLTVPSIIFIPTIEFFKGVCVYIYIYINIMFTDKLHVALLVSLMYFLEMFSLFNILFCKK